MDRTAPDKCVVLNQVFWLVLDDAFSWRSMSRLSCNTVEEVEHLAESQYLSIAASKSGAALKAIPKISKHLVAYMEGLVAVSPYKDGPFDSRAKGVAEHAATEAFNNLNKLHGLHQGDLLFNKSILCACLLVEQWKVIVVVRHAHGMKARCVLCACLLVEQWNVIVVVRHARGSLDCRRGSEVRFVPTERLLGEQWNVVVVTHLQHMPKQIVSLININIKLD